MIYHLHVTFLQCDAVDPADVAAVAKGVKRAIATYGTPALKEMIQNCMAQDLSWKVSMLSSHKNCILERKEDQFEVDKFSQYTVFKKFCWFMQGPSTLWEKMLLGLDVAGSEPGVEGEEIAPLAKENVATP